MSLEHQERIIDIDIAKGLAIFLVVVGHIVARQTPIGNEWYGHLKAAIYSFHMAFFMFLSGVIFFANLHPFTTINNDIFFLRKRFRRLMPAYLLFAVLVTLGKLLSQNYIYVDNPVKSIEDFLNILLFPMLSAASFLWYIYALFIISTVVFLGLRFTRDSLYLLLLLTLALLFTPYIQFLAIGQITRFSFFFILGGVAIRNWDFFVKYVDSTWFPIIFVFSLLLISDFYIGSGWLLTAILSIPALLGLCRKLPIGKGFFLYLGVMSFPIYLMNTMAIGLVKAVMLKFIDWNGSNFILFFPALMMAGIFLPILIKKFLFARVFWLNKITS
jgi:peptidoglycan/LPS O-acetylase OafA/YrhL